MSDRDMDDVLRDAAGASPRVDPALLDRITKAIGGSLRPVKPLPPAWKLVVAMVAVSMGIAGTGGMLLGLHGIARMSAPQVAAIFPMLGVLAVLAAAVAANQMVPGSRRLAAPAPLLAGSCLLFVAVCGLQFHDYRTESFVHQGMVCLNAGLLHAIPAALLGWLIWRRGFAVDSVAAGFAQGTLAGLAGAGMLELHCANFEAPHIMVWHTAVILCSGVGGALVGWGSRLRKNS